jgi:hypothetical protein
MTALKKLGETLVRILFLSTKPFSANRLALSYCTTAFSTAGFVILCVFNLRKPNDLGHESLNPDLHEQPTPSDNVRSSLKVLDGLCFLIQMILKHMMLLLGVYFLPQLINQHLAFFGSTAQPFLFPVLYMAILMLGAAFLVRFPAKHLLVVQCALLLLGSIFWTVELAGPEVAALLFICLAISGSICFEATLAELLLDAFRLSPPKWFWIQTFDLFIGSCLNIIFFSFRSAEQLQKTMLNCSAVLSLLLCSLVPLLIMIRKM